MAAARLPVVQQAAQQRQMRALKSSGWARDGDATGPNVLKQRLALGRSTAGTATTQAIKPTSVGHRKQRDSNAALPRQAIQLSTRAYIQA